MSICVILFKFGKGFFRKLLGYDAWVDIVVTLALPIWLGLTYSGVVLGIIAGLSMSIILFVAKNVLGYSRLERDGWKFHWVNHEAIWMTDLIGASESFHTDSNTSIKSNFIDAEFTEVISS